MIWLPRHPLLIPDIILPRRPPAVMLLQYQVLLTREPVNLQIYIGYKLISREVVVRRLVRSALKVKIKNKNRKVAIITGMNVQ